MDIKTILNQTIKDESNFSFEMRNLEHLSNAGFKCLHSGIYIDPYQEINREFDIRAFKTLEGRKHLALAVECKNISTDLPLIIHSTKIEINDRTHSLMVNYSGIKNDQKKGQITYIPEIPISRRPDSFCHEISHKVKEDGNIFPSLYSDFEYVGRSMDKLKSKNVDKKTVYYLGDEEIFPKFSQCQNSLVDFIDKAALEENENGIHQFGLFPILIVPNNALWEQRYNSNGTKAEEIFRTDRIPFCINKTYGKELNKLTPSYFVNFIEIVTEIGFINLLKILKGEEDRNLPTFLLEDELKNAVYNHISNL